MTHAHTIGGPLVAAFLATISTCTTTSPSEPEHSSEPILDKPEAKPEAKPEQPDRDDKPGSMELRASTAPRSRSYFDRWPERRVGGTCAAPTTDPATGATIGGCFPVIWVCCGAGGCVAMDLASDCEADLYWADCEAGESAIDPDTGLAIVICHD